MSKTSAMTMNRYYKQGQSSKVPYILALGIILLIWVMSKLHDDYKDLSEDYNCAMKEIRETDSTYRAQRDSLVNVIDSMRTKKAIPVPAPKKEWKTKKKEEAKPIAPETDKRDTL